MKKNSHKCCTAYQKNVYKTNILHKAHHQDRLYLLLIINDVPVNQIMFA